MEERKIDEIQFHDKMRGQETSSPEYDQYYTNRKYYSVVRKTSNFLRAWLLSRCAGKKVLVFGCGSGAQSFYLAKANATVCGIDISSVSIAAAREMALKEGLEQQVSFLVMDCESLAFRENCFDIIIAAGVLHHLYLPSAYKEMSRVLKPDGQVICVEALRHNPIIHLYRRLTPHLRTAWEARHILRVRDIRRAREYFGSVETRFQNLFTLAAVPFRKTRIFEGVLTAMEAIDSMVLRIPYLNWQAWQVVFVLSIPKKENSSTEVS